MAIREHCDICYPRNTGISVVLAGPPCFCPEESLRYQASMEDRPKRPCIEPHQDRRIASANSVCPAHSIDTNSFDDQCTNMSVEEYTDWYLRHYIRQRIGPGATHLQYRAAVHRQEPFIGHHSITGNTHYQISKGVHHQDSSNTHDQATTDTNGTEPNQIPPDEGIHLLRHADIFDAMRALTREPASANQSDMSAEAVTEVLARGLPLAKDSDHITVPSTRWKQLKPIGWERAMHKRVHEQAAQKARWMLGMA